ncbi:restriction endonuclease subunit S [Prevotella sp. TCVGH]|uniref:restriction endonuclease subunit S n=1 Tax=Prevotella sp. TCVGH TaxID=2182433 RepID=UPI00201D4E6F|nr:restriction endonuclease subunit S [Prevotella sp. TCVGH]MCL6748859.1 restriction endonuclease subunit S [Prevotella sp. TCVGH]
MKRYEEYKESGVKWIGKVPSHWEDCKIKFIASCNDDVLSEKTNTTEIIDYVEIGDVVYGQGITNSTQYEFADAPSRARRITKKGDIIVSTVRTYLKAIAPIDAIEPIVSTGFAVIRPRKIDSLFAAYTFTSDFFVEKVESLSVGVSYPAINASQIVNIKIPCPPLSEQRAIASYLDAETSKIDARIAKRRRQIELLQEYKQALITVAVTGKIDVRGINS